MSHGSQENRIHGSGEFHNLFRFKFIDDNPPVISVSVTQGDNNTQLQRHVLYAF